MANLIEFLRMVLSYLMTFAVIAVVAGVGGVIGVKAVSYTHLTLPTIEP